ncbi:MAG TPA: sigma 54-interacting transcriptional regulator [Bacteroidota bacterium]|nr:sigma 54-interacting transcriptional regulator [Bacteroidota bacterium]
MSKPQTLGDLRAAGYKVVPVKDEMRNTLIAKLRKNEKLFPGIIGYEQTVIPAIVNAILARHDIILLGLRGQAKTRIVRQLTSLLDEEIPIVRGSEMNDNPFSPVSKFAVDLVQERGDMTPIEWVPRNRRYGEKLATPDVTIADLIGDIDPIKAASQRLHYAHEGAIHFGIIPRCNRGIFAINELPDLQPRIQVGLFNILEEKDIQIRGFNIRIPLDVMLVFTANPEDYTNRGNIITPLKDRIDSQILTHYPKTLDDAIQITEQEAVIRREGKSVIVPSFFREIIEQIAFEARKSEFVDQKSGVSARLTISAMENLISNAERRAIMRNEDPIVPRVCDLPHVLPGLTGKMELVFEGEQEGAVKVSKALVGKAVRETFKHYFPDPLKKRNRATHEGGQQRSQGNEDPEYGRIIQWFESGNKVEVSDDMPRDDYFKELDRVKGLKELTKKHMAGSENQTELAPMMEFVLDGLHQNSKIAKDEVDHITSYKDMVGSIFVGQGKMYEED